MHVVSSGEAEAWVEYLCDDEISARREAEKRASADTEGAEWIYLRREDGHWVARRVPPNWEAAEPKPESMKSAIFSTLLNPFDWGWWS